MSGGILTVALNAAVDISYIINDFGIGKINTTAQVVRQAGGKANNVARVLASLGQRVTATGFAGGNAGRFILESLQSEGIRVDYEMAESDSRSCFAIVDPVGRSLTEIREQGPTLTQAHADRFVDRFRRLAREVELVVISGSLPPGIPADFYATLVSEAYRTAQVRTILDASGKALREALRSQPYLVKPNQEELEEWHGSPLPDEAAIVGAARRLMTGGPLVVAVSLGARGLLLVSPEGTWRATPPRVEAVNTVGSGDSLVAGFAAGLLQGLPAEEVLRLAVGCGTANALNSAVAVVHAEDLARVRAQIRVDRIE